MDHQLEPAIHARLLLPPLEQTLHNSMLLH